MKKRQENDLKLIHEILDENTEKAKTTLYRKYYNDIVGNVRAFNYRFDNDTVTFIVTDIFIKIFLNLNKYDKEKSCFRTWIVRISGNHLIDYYRKSVRKKLNYVSYNDVLNTNTLEFSTYNIQSSIHNHDDQFMYNDALSYLHNNLPSKECAILDLKLQGYSNTEIGSMKNMTSSNVVDRLKNIKTKLLD